MTKPDTSTWSAVGDTVAIYELGDFTGPRAELVPIAKLTATQAVISRGDLSELRFRRADGRMVGYHHGPQLKRPELREVQDALAARTILSMSVPLGNALKAVRSRESALRALHELNRLVQGAADKLGVNRADLV